MTTFSELQMLFHDYILFDDNHFSNHIIETSKVSKETRLNIYKNAYFLRLLEALSDSYPVLKTVLGEDSFTQLGIEYIQATPSTFRSIRWFGDQLAAFLSSHENYQDKPYLSELAQLEWTSALVFDAADADCITLESMTAIPATAWENMRIQIHPSLYRVDFFWNVIEIRESSFNDNSLKTPTKSNVSTQWIFWRQQLTNKYLSLKNTEAAALDTIIAGKTFGEMCEILCEYFSENEVGLQAATFLKTWIVSGMVSSIDFEQ